MIHCAVQWTAALVVLASLMPARDCNQDIINDVTQGFGEALKHCREESNLTEEMMEEFFFFWRDDFDFTMRELGCAIKCMGKFFDLLTSEHRMHRERTESFIKSFPNGEVLSKQMTDIIRECEIQHDEHEDHCWRILKVAECFKNTCKKLGIAPSMEVVMVELMMEAE